MKRDDCTTGLDDIDIEIQHTLDRAESSAAAIVDDQATRLRRMVERATGEPVRAPVPIREHGASQDPVRTGLAKVIAVASGKGGVGKTNFAVNLSVALARRGLRVVLIDADLGTANADVLCGLNPAARLNHLVTPLPVHDGAKRSAADTLVEAPGGFRLLPGAAGVSRMADLSASEQRKLLAIIGELERDADVLIVDTAAGVGRSVTSLVEAADMGIVVTTPEPTAIADAYALVKCVVLAESGQWQMEHAARLRFVVNQSGPSGEAEAVHARLSAVCQRFLGVSVVMLGEIAQDLRVAQSVRARRPFLLHAPECQAARHMVVLSEKIIQQLGLRRDLSVDRGRGGFMSALARVLLGRTS
jgi:flagellar biosynthesis protein FlhG